MMSNIDSFHIPVLPQESVRLINVKADGTYIDCTLGEGGHSSLILKGLSEKGHLISFDHDQSAIQFVQEKFSKELSQKNWTLINDNFSNMDKHIEKGSVDGILMDLGISSRHIDIPGKGFSYKNENDPLDMRMDENLGVKAMDLLNLLNWRQLAELFDMYGEERFSKRIARSIKNSPQPITTVGDLNSIISRAVPAASSTNIHPSRRVFQALRIAVNDEISSLQSGLVKAFTLLKADSDSRLVVISFHSLEDRAVKEFFKGHSEEGNAEILTPKPLTPTEKELSRNPRSRSAKLRACRKK